MPGEAPRARCNAGEEINLEGWECYDAAVHCASICAGQRTAKALNLRDAGAVLGNATLAAAAVASREPHVLVDEPEQAPPGCLRQAMNSVTSFWCGASCLTLQSSHVAGSRMYTQQACLMCPTCQELMRMGLCESAGLALCCLRLASGV